MQKNNYLQTITSVMGLVILLASVSGLILNLSNQPELLQTFSIVGYIVLSIGVLLFVFSAKDISQIWRWVFLGFLYLATIPFFIWVGSWHQPSNKTELVNFPLNQTRYDFENSNDETDITPWIAIPRDRKYKAIISEDFAMSGTHSLRLVVDMQSYITNKNTEYAGIEPIGITPFQAKIITAWVFIPQSEPIQGINFNAHILAYIKDENGVPGGFVGETKQVNPGTWTPLFIGTFGETTDVLGNLKWNGKIDILYLTVWSDKPYNGSIYIDDFSIYE